MRLRFLFFNLVAVVLIPALRRKVVSLPSWACVSTGHRLPLWRLCFIGIFRRAWPKNRGKTIVGKGGQLRQANKKYVRSID